MTSAQFYLFSSTTIPVKQRCFIPVQSSPNAHIAFAQRAYKRSPLSTPLHSSFDLQGRVSPFSGLSQEFLHRQLQQPQPYLHETLQANATQTLERHHALVMERLGEDLGTLFRRHLLKKVKPAAYQGPSLKRRHSVAALRPAAESVGWEVDTIAWLGCHALKRLEHMHGKGLVHRDIVGYCLLDLAASIVD